MNSANGEVECKDLIEAHKEYRLLPPGALKMDVNDRCMAGFGFKV